MTDLYDKYGKLAYSVIYRIVRDVGIAEDLVQETFLRVWNRAQGFDAERGALGPWLLEPEAGSPQPTTQPLIVAAL